MESVPDVSAVNVEEIEIDNDTLDMLKSMNMGDLSGLKVEQQQGGQERGDRRDRREGRGDRGGGAGAGGFN